MRDLKFRAWHTENKKMTESFEYGSYLNEQTSDCKYEIMQYTGLKDKEGIELFEDDLVETAKDCVWRIFWDERYGKMMYGKGNTSFGLTRQSAKRLLKVGNIHENPELLV